MHSIPGYRVSGCSELSFKICQVELRKLLYNTHHFRYGTSKVSKSEVVVKVIL